MRPFLMALVLAIAASAMVAVPADAQTPNARVFNSGSGLILYTIKAANTADFENVMNRTKEALGKSAKPERKQQAATWRVFKSADPAAAGNVMYVMVIDPAIKDADYNVINILNEVFPAEVQALYKAYTEAFAGSTFSEGEVEPRVHALHGRVLRMPAQTEDAIVDAHPQRSGQLHLRAASGVQQEARLLIRPKPFPIEAGAGGGVQLNAGKPDGLHEHVA
jgi:hypothetical protein